MTQFFLKGDFRFFWPENIKDFATLPFAWDSSLNTGIGQSQLPALWITSYFNFTALFSKLGLDWNLIQLIFWVLPAILLSFFSAFFLFKHLFSRERDPAAAGKDKRYSILSGIIYSLNTYFLMILTGGQLGVALAYSIAPLVLVSFIKLIDNLSSQSYNFKFQISNFKLPIVAGLVLGFQIIFDPRIVYITLVTTFFYSVFNFSDIKRVIKNSLAFFVLPLIIAILMNIFWILPLILTKSSPIPEGFNSLKSFEFFSFSDFSHSLSLLHPNWPENIFGKTYFLDPKFLILPIVAFSSLLFSKSKNILYFVIIALLGIFLAKGANPPFGEINSWLFQNLPGMSMFRDPTKWYILVALSYSILIPFSISNISEWVQLHFKISNIKYQISNIFLLFTIFYLLFLMSPVFGQIKIRQVPQEYVQLKNFLVPQPEFFRTLWIPKWQRLGYFSNNHPAIGREELFIGDYKKQMDQLKKLDSEELLRELSVRYVVVPYDSEGEMFLEDRKYSEKKRIEVEKKLDQIPWLKKLDRFNDLNHLSKIAVYEIKGSKDRFWSPSTGLRINYNFLSPTEYKVQVKNAEKGDLLIFSESFDKNWIAEFSSKGRSASGGKVQSSPRKISGQAEVMLNSFVLKEGDYEFVVYYAPQKYVEAGLWLSLATLLTSISYILFGKRVKKW